MRAEGKWHSESPCHFTEAIASYSENAGYKYYLQAFQYGMPSHGGFGLGLERLTQRIIGFRNIKEATLFPRDMKRLTP